MQSTHDARDNDTYNITCEIQCLKLKSILVPYNYTTIGNVHQISNTRLLSHLFYLPFFAQNESIFRSDKIVLIIRIFIILMRCQFSLPLVCLICCIYRYNYIVHWILFAPPETVPRCIVNLAITRSLAQFWNGVFSTTPI